MDGVIPARHGKSAYKYTWDDDGAVRNVEPLEKIGEDAQLHSSSNNHVRQGSRPKVWPFHHRGASEVPSTPVTSHFRRATAQTKTFFRAAEDSASTISRSLVPDYVANYIRGETPESLARKKEQRAWGERGVEITPHRDRFVSQVGQIEGAWGSGVNLTTSNEYANEGPQRGLRRLLTGWRGGVAFNTLLSLLILLVAVVCLIIVVTKSQIISGESTIFSGSCQTAASINTALHVVINIFTIIILAGGNYVFQVLSSPTRNELAVAHDKKRWLDIGIPSLRNLPHISGFRTSLATIILLAAVATHVIYNAVIFASQTGLDYDVVFITEPFLRGAPFSNATGNNDGGLSSPELLELQAKASESKLVNLTTDQCLQEFGGSFETSFNAVLLVVETAATTTALVQTGRSGTSLKTYSQPSSEDELALDGSLVQYCLARQGSSQICSITASISLLGVVAALNLATLLCVTVVLTRSKFEPLTTLGDAVRSFLRSPDHTTAGTCLLTKSDVMQGRWGFQEAKYYVPRGHFWLFTPSLSRWALLVISWLVLAVPTAVVIGLVMSKDAADLLTPFGTATPYTTIIFPAPITKSQMSLLASLPQLLLGILYLTTNAHLTTYFLSHELTLFALGPKSLRVSSDATGYQTTSLYLTLPRPVSWILLAFFVVMGFVLSQAVFSAIIVLSPSLSASDSDSSQIIAISFSTQALLVLLALLVVLILGVLVLGLRRAPAAVLVNGQEKGNPLAMKGGSCSAALSAKCHLAAGEHEPWRQELTWGVVTEGLGAQEGRCAFSSVAVGAVDTGRCYA
ncbi:hypothetical protein BJ170DRAFT_186368 [Xylariales sp. AK1849]|nr:hypothetical protein BJ170DRAFT_186368 [Xylariales sp. AK1849]